MKPIYCTDSQDRIPPEFFTQGKAVWSNGKAYLKVHADRLGLKPDASPPKWFLELTAPAPKPPEPQPPKPPLPDILIGSTIHGPTPPVKNPLLASTVAPVSDKDKKAEPDKKAPVVEVKAGPIQVPAEKAADQVKSDGKPPAPHQPAVEVKSPNAPAPAKTPEAKAGAPDAKAPPIANPPSGDAKPAANAAAKPIPQPAKADSAAKPAVPAAAKAATAPAPAGPAAPAPGAKPADAKKKEEPEVKIELEGEKLSIEEMASLSILEGIPIRNIELLYGGIVRRRFSKGQIVCLEGQYASTAFYIVSGKAEVYINTPVSKIVKGQGRVEKRGGFKGFFQKLKAKLEGRKSEPDAGLPGKSFIPTDFADLDLPLDNPVAEMVAGDLFGEMSCLNFYPRSATVRAKEDCEMFEMIRTVLDTVKKSPKSKFKEKLDKQYRTRALEQHLRSIPLLKNFVDESIINQLRYKVELQDYDPGDVIIKQGDAPDAFYLIRRGCVKVSQSHPGGEIVLTYLGRSESFGEIGLVKNTPRTATCTALDHVEVVKIGKRDFEFILDSYEDLKRSIVQEAEQRLERTKEITTHAPATPLDEFLEQGLMQAQSLLLLDLEKCTRCDECVRGCADSHGGVTRLVREGLRFDKYLVATSCRSCMDPVCMIGCPVGSIRRKESMEIIIEDWCIGCAKCANQCPYGNIAMHDFALPEDEQERLAEKEAQKAAEKAAAPPAPPKPAAPAKEGEAPKKDPAPAKAAQAQAAAEKVLLQKAAVKTLAVTCDLCTELPEPNCVYACPHDAAHRVDARQFFEMGGAQATKQKAKA